MVAHTRLAQDQASRHSSIESGGGGSRAFSPNGGASDVNSFWMKGSVLVKGVNPQKSIQENTLYEILKRIDKNIL